MRGLRRVLASPWALAVLIILVSVAVQLYILATVNFQPRFSERVASVAIGLVCGWVVHALLFDRENPAQ